MKLFFSIFFFILLTFHSFSNDTIKTREVDNSYSVDAMYKKLSPEYSFITPYIPKKNESVIITNNIVYADYGLRQLCLYLYSPKNINKKKAAVILIHGGGWSSGNKELQKPMALFLASKGLICVTVEYRLSTEAIYPAAVFDVKTAIRWLRQNAKVLGADIKKIAILGCSSGGQLASLVGATNGTDKYINELYPSESSDVQALVNIDGILAFIHPESGEGVDKEDNPSSATKWLGGSSKEIPYIWNEASALTHAGKTFPPILIINSKFKRFHSGRNDLIQKLDSLGIYSEVHEFSDAPHAFWLFDPWFDQTAEYTFQFLKKQFEK